MAPAPDRGSRPRSAAARSRSRPPRAGCSSTTACSPPATASSTAPASRCSTSTSRGRSIARARPYIIVAAGALRVRGRRAERRLPLRGALRRATRAAWRSTTAARTRSPASPSPTSTSSSSSRGPLVVLTRREGGSRALRDGDEDRAGNPYGYLRRRSARVRDHAPRHADAVDQLPRRGPLRRHRLEHGGGFSFDRDPRHRPRQPLPVQRRPGRPAGPVRLPARPGERRVLERDLAAGQADARRIRVPPRRRLHADRGPVRGIASEHPLLRPARRGRRRLAVRALGAAHPECLRPHAPAPHLQLRRAQLRRRDRRPAEPRLGAAHRPQPVRGRRHPRRHRLPARRRPSSRRTPSRRATTRDRETSSAAAATSRARSSSRQGEPTAPGPRAETASARSSTTSSSCRARSGEIVFVLGIADDEAGIDARRQRLPRPGGGRGGLRRSSARTGTPTCRT